MLVFDEELSGTGPYSTSHELSESLGRYDQLSIQAVVDKVSAAGATLSAQIQHAADGRSFVNKNTSPELVTPPLAVATTNIASGGDPSLAPTLGYVRLAISLSASINAHVKVYVTMRDQGGAAPEPSAGGRPILRFG